MVTEKSPSKTKPAPLTILGTHINSDAYPNVKYRVASLLRTKGLAAREINFPLTRIQWFGQRQSKVSTVFHWLASVARFASVHVQVVLAAITLGRVQRVYVPYPAIVVLYLLSVLPARWRPNNIYADAFISIYDTVVRDRRIISPDNPLARLLYSIERRAYRCADKIFVDTDLNARYLCETFNLAQNKVIPLPLTINEEVYAPQRYTAHGMRCKVLFTGTFVPLQGVEVIARAIVLLQAHKHIHFRLIGDGQTSAEVSEILRTAGGDNVSWERGWQSASALAEEIRQSDICLGIFGSGEKTQRVWPLKNYAYMAVGRAIITGDTSTARTLLSNYADESFMTVATGQPEQLAQAIADLAGDAERRTSLAINARLQYEKQLSEPVSLAKLLREIS